MVFRRLLGSMGVGGPQVDTVLAGGAVVPGGTLSGQVCLLGGESAERIEHIGLELLARVEAEHDDGESEGAVVFERFTVGGGFVLGPHEERAVPFSVPVPWETPVTELYGQPLGIVLGVRTELAVAGARDKGDLDPLVVRPLPVQEAVLEALGQLGCGFRSADLEYGHIGGTGQTLPFYQEIELTPAPQYAHAVSEFELTFIASPAGCQVVVEADRRGGLFSSGHDELSRVSLGHADAHTLDWNAEVDGWLRRLTDRPAHQPSLGHQAAPYACAPPVHHDPYGHGAHGHQDPYGHQGHHVDHGHHVGHGHHGHHDPYDRHDGHGSHGSYDSYDPYDKDDDHRSGPGVGTAIAAGAAGLAVGFVGGMVADEIVDEIGDFFDGDDD
ncbi:sporulation protein [Streptomyces mangrovisoli]|uniref:Sporulation protein n=1 Tax=Streptomyces mangrovisoli TaxID=1428628 RepID=A0A1J4NKX3_9ACTN|nr:sporulation protein [Streptomyces mangrovisoli]OIJ63041.1 sporulation protein [Streptomyces mangrovisoli]